MRLRSIKLAGFKSFVDPTTVNFPSNMAAVVGPNGCGKSNIIDAVRWVMGESSAKNLRGESMTDVIFNGSNSRKPVSQASIELIFDNSDHTLVGEYASYAEISIRRRVTREGQNTYFLNGTKCRRRDITDIFLGTGLGPRSYSIIEQGMISKLIEARPEDLRHYIEEAAGISKYKERRRETENRIRRTQENLARLTDLREELERQLERLHRQAQSAERFQAFKQEERQLKAQLQAVRWRELDGRVEQREKVIRDQETALEALTAEQRQADAGIERLRDGHHELSEAFNLVQGRFYSLGGDIARLEQTIQHGQQRQRQLQDDLREAEQARSEAESHLEHDRVLLATFEEELAMLEPEEEAARELGEEGGAALEEAELALADWQQRWEALSAASIEPQREADVQQARIRSLEQGLERGMDRQRRLRDERTLLGEDGPSERLVMLEEQIAEDELLLEGLAEQELQVVEGLQRLREELLGLAGEQSQRQGELQRLEGRIASLEALQQAALAPDTGAAQWLEAEGLTQAPQLADDVQVTPGWELAVETVLGSDLQAVCLDDLAPLRLATFASGALNLALPGSLPVAAGSLLEEVQAPRDLSPWLGQVLIANSYDEALARRPALAPGQSLITPEGYWVSRHFLRVRRAQAAEGSVLARGRELEELQARRLELSEALALQEERLEDRRAAQQRLESEREDARRRQKQEQQRLAESRAQLSAQQARAEQLSIRRQQLEADLQDVEQQLAREQEELGECRLRLQDALDAMAVDTEQRALLQEQRDRHRQAVEAARQRQRQAQEQLHQLTVRLTTLRAQRQSTLQALERLELQTARLGERCEQLNLNLEEGGEPLDELRLRLEELLERRLQVDEEMRTARLALEDADRELRDFERRRLQAEQQATLLRGQLEQHRLEWQGLATRRSGFAEQLAADGYDLPTVIATLPAEASEAAWEEQLEAVAARIGRLGPINLAAIDEYQQQAERKTYLDAQNADLVEALETLESVIRKIDRETRNRFKDTFDQINHGLQALFPKVFGGGSAYLELTGEDLLDTGVAIMARPPGKKNSTIHLLSGGEKALTALALVFAIFQLNPAPFCMLDEVDAPLDDANVGRYARLVKSMSEKVQFIYITHNKIAMEMADQLLGVTMHEPGCSRLVAVDVEEAVAMVDA